VKTRTVHLDAVCERIDYGFTASADFSVKEPRLLRITDIQEGSVDWNHVPGCRITPEEEADKRLCAGDIVFARTGATTGKCFLIEYAPRAVFASYLIRLRATDEILPQYLYAFFQSEHYWHQIKGAVRGAAQGGVNSTTLSSLVLPLPDPSEQRRIAGRLEQADRLRRTRRYALELTDTFLPAAFLELFGPRLKSGPFRPFGQLVKITGGGTPARERPEFYQGRIPWLTSKDMKGDYIWDTEEHITEKALEESATNLVPAGSILVVVKSKVLMHRLPVAIAKVPLCHGQDIKSIQCSGALQPAFARFVLKFYEGRLLNLARGANTEGLTLPMLEELPVPTVLPSEQEHFAELVMQHERLRAVQREALRQAEHLFASLLARAFSADSPSLPRDSVPGN
jgi:type I restriction enzyme, S subunit